MVKKYIVDLDGEERQELHRLLSGGQAPVRKVRRAHILLLAAEDLPDAVIADSLHCGASTVERTRRRFVEGGLQRALEEDPRPGACTKLDGKQQAMVLALACSPAPDGAGQWSLRLLADRLVALEVVDSISHETVRQTLKKGL